MRGWLETTQEIPQGLPEAFGDSIQKIGAGLPIAHCGGFECLLRVLFMQLDIQASIFSVKWEISLLAKSKRGSYWG